MGEKWSDYIQGEKQLDGNDWLGEHKKWRPATGTARLWHVKWGTGRFPFKHHQQQQMVWRQEGNNAVSQQKIYWLALEVEKCSWGDVGTGLLPQAPCWGRKSPLRQDSLSGPRSMVAPARILLAYLTLRETPLSHEAVEPHSPWCPFQDPSLLWPPSPWAHLLPLPWFTFFMTLLAI